MSPTIFKVGVPPVVIIHTALNDGNKLPTIFTTPDADIFNIYLANPLPKNCKLPVIFKTHIPDFKIPFVVLVVVEFLTNEFTTVVTPEPPLIVKQVVDPGMIPLSVQFIVLEVEQINPPPATAGDWAVVLKDNTVISWSIVTVNPLE
jgi:hypothetical protein